jgi:hypothetical protein
MKMTTLVKFVSIAFLCMVAFTLRGQSLCPEGVDEIITTYTCSRLNYELQSNVDQGNGVPSTFEWRILQQDPNLEVVEGSGAPLVIRDTLFLLSNFDEGASVVYEVTPIGPEGCRGENFTVQVDVLPPPEVTGCLACNNSVNITMKKDCQTLVILDEVAEGFRGADCKNLEVLREALYVAVFDGVYPDGDPFKADNIIDRKGTFNYEIRLRSTFGDCFEWVPCWGQIIAEDKSGPSVECPPDVIGLVKKETSEKNAEAIVEGVPYEYRPGGIQDGGCPDATGCDYSCPPATEGFNYLVCTEIDSIYQRPESYDDETYPYYTGKPEVFDCSPYELVDVKDTKTDYACGELLLSGRRVLKKIERIFRYRDEEGNLGECTQRIYFFQPEILLPDCEVQLYLCDFPGIGTADAGGRLDPVQTNTAPYYFNALCERVPLTDHTCQITVDYEDEVFAGPENCGVKVERRWTFLDWCWSPDYGCDNFDVPAGCQGALSDWTNKERTYKQVIIVKDDIPPTVTCPDLRDYSVGPFICRAIISPPPPVITEECSDWTWAFELYGDVTDPRTGITTPNQLIAVSNENNIVTGIAPGEYDLHYLVTDACGNTGRAVCPVRVVDAVNPVAICNRDLKISLGGAFTVAEGIARVDAEDIDEGSWDNCSLRRLETRREIDNGCVNSYTETILGLTFPEDFTIRREGGTGITYYLNGADTLLVEEESVIFSWWSGSAFFTCCDISESDSDRLRVELRATDAAGNTNICWLQVHIEDKLPPSCEVSDARILCTELDFDPLDPGQVAARFGAPGDIVTINDNCSAFLDELLVWEPEGCGSGVLKRQFTVTDGSNLSGSCTQKIVVEEVNRYDIRFPRDLSSAECGVAPSDSLIHAIEGCDVLAISRDTARYDASGDECFKLFITYNIVNWCEYAGESVQPTLIPRDIDEDDDLKEYTWMEAGEDPVFAETYLPGETASFLVKLFGAKTDGSRQDLPERVLVRADCPERDLHIGYRTWKHQGQGTYTLACNKDLDNICENELYESQCWTPGLYQYTQVLKVYDNTPPVVQVLSNDFEFCAYGDPATGCNGKVEVALGVTDECTVFDAELSRVELLIDGDPGKAVGPDDGLFQVIQSNNEYLFTGNLPIGAHTFVTRFVDGCGNVTGKRVDVSVVDCKSPAPVCINGVALELMPVDEDGDGTVDGGMNVLRASSLIASMANDCSGEVTYSINLFGEEPDPTRTSLTVSCDDPLFETIPVEVWAWDPAGNGDRCETFFIVEDLQSLCSRSGDGDIAGIILTEEDEPVEGVEVKLSGRKASTTMTQPDGRYLFENLQEGYDYTVTPFRDGDYLNGVSTFDLVLISKHILQVKPFDSPYKLIAADANRSNSVTTLDLIQLRKLILTVDTKLKNNTSWRFLPADFEFSNPENPFSEPFPEVLNFNNLAAIMNKGDFIGVKVGDVNLSARPNGLAAAEVRGTAATFRLGVTDQLLHPGREYTIPFTSSDLPLVAGFQFSLFADPALLDLTGLEPGLTKADNFGFFPEKGLITTSWHTNNPLSGMEDHLFSLVIRARKEVRLSDVLSLASRPTPPEAYTADGVQWNVDLSFATSRESIGTPRLLPNRPNPFRTSTVLPFELPQPGKVTLSVYDESGRRVYVHQAFYEPGYYEHRLDRALEPLSGVFYYALEVNGHRLTRSMIRVE